jgi:hypothetical protein
MNNIPLEAQYYYHHTYYQFGECYARYYSKNSWRDSASVTNEDLVLHGVKIKNKDSK